MHQTELIWNWLGGQPHTPHAEGQRHGVSNQRNITVASTTFDNSYGICPGSWQYHNYCHHTTVAVHKLFCRCWTFQLQFGENCGATWTIWDSSLVWRVICLKRIGIGLGLGLASNFGICTTPFRTNDPSDKWPVTAVARSLGVWQIQTANPTSKPADIKTDPRPSSSSTVSNSAVRQTISDPSRTLSARTHRTVVKLSWVYWAHVRRTCLQADTWNTHKNTRNASSSKEHIKTLNIRTKGA